MAATTSTRVACAHCGLPVGGLRTSVVIEGEERFFCCSGCVFVYQLAGGGDTPGGSAVSWQLILLGFGVVLSGFLMTFSWAIYLNPDISPETHAMLNYVMLALATPVIFGVGFPYYRLAAQELAHARLSMSSLIAFGTLAAYLYSAWLTFRRSEHVYFDTASMVIVLVTLGRYLEARARARAGMAMRTFAAETPPRAFRLRDGNEEEVEVEVIQRGDLLRVLPGARIPVDGRIQSGRTTVDESLLTGESLPVARGPGDTVFQGTLNQDGAVVLEALEVGEGTLQARIEQLLSTALAARMPLEALVDRISAAFVVFTVGLALGVGIFYWHQGRTADGLLNSLAVLVVACPCALGLATPLAGFVALQRAAREGVLLRSMEVLEKLARLDTVVFDKTGTLTEGSFRVAAIRPAPGVSADRVLHLAASLESSSEHHLARAIVHEARARGLDLTAPRSFVNHPGEGVEGEMETPGGRAQVVLGTLRYLRGRGLEVPPGLENSAPETGYGTEVYVGWDGRGRGAITLEDGIREDSRAAVLQCRKAGLELHLLSGDRRASTERVAGTLQIPHSAAEQLPVQKVAYIAELQKTGRRVAMVGDGVNDAPALAQADVGFTHQMGTEMSREAADVHVLGTSLVRIPWSVSFARKAFRHIRQNLFWAFFYNVIAMGLAAAGWLRPVWAAVAMIASSMMVVGNSFRLGRTRGIAFVPGKKHEGRLEGTPTAGLSMTPADAATKTATFSPPGSPSADRSSIA
jgi:Cu+-exporting ATPase